MAQENDSVDPVGTVAGENVCPSCGAENPAGNRFCGTCGAALNAVTAAVPLPAPVIPPPAAETTAAAIVPPPLPAPPVKTVPAAATDAITRERERDKLLTLANVQRMRGQTDEARRTLTQTIALSEGLPGREIAPTYELLGDLYATEGRIEEARDAFSKAHELDQTRASAERKFATMTLRMAETNEGAALAEAMLRGDSITDLLSASAQGRKRNAGTAMFLSFVPGFGQFYNGQFFKGALLLGVWSLCLVVFTLSSDRDQFFKAFARMFALKPAGVFPPLLSLIGVVMVAVWLYSIVDAPFMAGKGPQSNDTGPKIDKTGWEV